MYLTKFIENLFKRFLPSPFIIAVILTFTTIILAVVFSNFVDFKSSLSFFEILSSWERGIWNKDLLVFAYQMILILVLGNILALSPPVSKVILTIAKYATSTEKAVVIVSFSVMLVAFFNWGLGLIFGAILARKIGDYSAKNNIKLNYPLVGAAGYVGMMVWHSGISGSAPIKVAENNHLLNLMSSRQDSYIYEDLPVSLNFDLTVLSNANLITFLVLLVLVPLTFHFLSKNTEAQNNILKSPVENQNLTSTIKSNGLEGSRLFSITFGVILLSDW